MYDYIAALVAGDKLGGLYYRRLQCCQIGAFGYLLCLGRYGHSHIGAYIAYGHAVVCVYEYIVQRGGDLRRGVHAELLKNHGYGIAQFYPLEQGEVSVLLRLLQLHK